MTKTTFTSKNVDVNGTSLQGFITCSYDTLCEVFGEPIGGDGYKTRAEWEGKTSDGTVFTIYDWKERQPIGDVTDWHIGGRDTKSVQAIHDIVNETLGEQAKYTTRLETIRTF
jgi:hypothetical protein